MIVFFFFKQKTAYEMRISDWSSDVCSSDLPPPDLGGDGHYLTGVTRHQGELIQLVDVESVLAESAPRASDAAGISPLPMAAGVPREVLVVDDSREIGRASGRERVCQSV